MGENNEKLLFQELRPPCSPISLLARTLAHPAALGKRRNPPRKPHNLDMGVGGGAVKELAQNGLSHYFLPSMVSL